MERVEEKGQKSVTSDPPSLAAATFGVAGE
jgi:hypothetical protein